MKTSPCRRAISRTAHLREIENAAPCNGFGIRVAGGQLMAAGAAAAWVSMVLIAVHSQHRFGTAPYQGVSGYGTLWYQVLARARSGWISSQEATWQLPSLTTRLR